MSERVLLCPHCKNQIEIQKVLELLRPEGYEQAFKVRVRVSGEIAILQETDINPFVVEILPD
jgi:hypothetical protein